MPCRDDRSDYEAANRNRENLQKIDDLTAMLCSACKALENDFGYDFDKNPLLSRWWDDHKKADLLAAQEAARKKLQHDEAVLISQKPFAQLTESDKQILKREGFL